MEFENIKNSLLGKIDNMTIKYDTCDVFEIEIVRSGWYKSLGFSPQFAYDLKKRFKQGKLSEDVMTDILEKLGWKKTVFWEKS